MSVSAVGGGDDVALLSVGPVGQVGPLREVAVDHDRGVAIGDREGCDGQQGGN